MALPLTVACRQILAIPERPNITGGRHMVEMQLDRPDAELTEHPFNALVDDGVIGAVASDKLFDNRAYRRGSQLPMRNEHQRT
jgi:hypothetical protein